MLLRILPTFLLGFAAAVAHAQVPELGTVVDNWPGRNVILGEQPTATVADYEAIKDRYFQAGALSTFAVGEGFGAELPPRERATALQHKVWEMLLREGADPIARDIQWSEVKFPRVSTGRNRTPRGTSFIERQFYVPNGINGQYITGKLAEPVDGRPHAQCGVVYHHFHGGFWGHGTDELFFNWQTASGAWGHRLLDYGCVVIAIDVLGFRERQRPGTDGPTEEKILFAELARTGKSRVAMRLYDDYLALELLRKHPNVDPSRIGAMGMSMGSGRTVLLAAAAPDKLKVAISLGSHPRIQPYMERGFDPWTGHNWFQSMFAERIDWEHLLAAAAGVNTMAIMGERDPSSPGWREALPWAKSFSNAVGQAEFEWFEIHDAGGDDHAWNGEAIQRAEAFMLRHLGG